MEEQQLEELLAASQPDPDLGASAALLRRAGWKLWVISAGSSWYVERVLSRAGAAATVYSSPGRRENGAGSYWRSWTLHPHIIRHRWAWTNRP